MTGKKPGAGQVSNTDKWMVENEVATPPWVRMGSRIIALGRFLILRQEPTSLPPSVPRRGGGMNTYPLQMQKRRRVWRRLFRHKTNGLRRRIGVS